MASVIEATQALPERFEVVNGEVMEVPPVSGFAAEVANRIRDELTVYGRTTNRGRTRNDMLFRLPLPEDRSRNRAPDVAFISYDRWPADRVLPYRSNPVDVVPELVVEVASPTDEVDELFAKAHEYLRAGVNLVWLVIPRIRQVYALASTTQPPRVFDESSTLDGGDVLPGFAAGVAALIPAVVMEEG